MKSLLIDKIKFKLEHIAGHRIRLVPLKKNHESIPALAECILENQLTGIENVVSTDSEMLISYTEDLNLITKQLQAITHPSLQPSSHFSLPVCFSKGLDWKDVESQTRLKKNKVISVFLETSFSFEMYGFLPGFMYLTGLPKSIQCLRKSKPRQRVKAGSLALGGHYAGIYNIESPGGWQSIAYCPVRLFSLDRIDRPIIKINDTINFTKISLKESKDMDEQQLSLENYRIE